MARVSPLALSFDVLVHHLLSPVRRPFLASYKLTYACNLRCAQCPFPSYTSPSPSFEQVCQTLDCLRERGSRVVIFEGGEPLLWRDGSYAFEDVVRAARERFTCVGATTNGTLPLEVSTDILWVSIDGFSETHNRLRPGSPREESVFDRVMENIARSAHPRLYAHITANSENHREIPDLVRFLSGKVRGITVQFYYPYTRDDRLYLLPPLRRALLDHLVELKREGYPVLNSTTALRALRDNRWRCLPWLIDCANPDGSLSQGCYLQGRAEIDCSKCGFSPYTEISLAFRGRPLSVLAGMRIFA